MVCIDSLRPGDKVRIVDDFNDDECFNVSKMDKWRGQIMTVREVHPDGGGFDGSTPYALMLEDEGESAQKRAYNGWFWVTPAIQEIVSRAEPPQTASDSELTAFLGF